MHSPNNDPVFYTPPKPAPFINRTAVLVILAVLALVALNHFGARWYLDNAYHKITPGMSRDQVKKALWLCLEHETDVYDVPDGVGASACDYYLMTDVAERNPETIYIVYDARQRVVWVNPLFKHRW